ncbi:unnamed protein product [Closterium sp. NIES-54]
MRMGTSKACTLLTRSFKSGGPRPKFRLSIRSSYSSSYLSQGQSSSSSVRSCLCAWPSGFRHPLWLASFGSHEQNSPLNGAPGYVQFQLVGKPLANEHVMCSSIDDGLPHEQASHGQTALLCDQHRHLAHQPFVRVSSHLRGPRSFSSATPGASSTRRFATLGRFGPWSESDILLSPRVGHDDVLPRVVPFAFFLGFIHFFVRQQRPCLFLRRIRQLLESPLQPTNLDLEIFPSCPQRVSRPAVTLLLPMPTFPAQLTCRHVGAFTLQVPVLSTASSAYQADPSSEASLACRFAESPLLGFSNVHVSPQSSARRVEYLPGLRQQSAVVPCCLSLRELVGELSAGEESTDSDVVGVPISKPELRRTSRARRPPERLSFHACLPPAAFTAMYDEVDDDLLNDDAEEDDEHCWDIAMMTVKELVERPRGVNIMKNRWVLTTKYRLDDTVEHEKARLVVKGFTQVCGADYDETYSPMSSYIMLRIFLSIIAVFDLNLMELDMKNAFLQSKLDRVLYMYQPDYFDDGTGRVFKLLKSLYGLKQSPLLWYRALDGVLLGAGWKKSQVDEALYFKVGDIGVTCWVLVDVDDLLAASSSPVMLKELKQLLEDAFELREISPVVKRFIDEEQGGRVPKTPVSVDAYAELTFDDEEAQEREEDEYRQKVGSLQFAATTTRPDIAFACSKLGSGLRVRSEVDRCLAYLADTRDTALEFGSGPESLELIGYVDANDAGDKQKRTRTSSYVFIYGGAAVSWSSSRIKCATLLSTESEYVVATNAGKEGRRLRFLLAKFKLLNAGKPTILRVDNKSAITVAEGLGLTGNLKHMERSYAWLQHIVRSGKFVLNYIPTTEQPADFLTKALHFPAFNRCSDAIGQVRLADVGDGDDDVQQ